MPGEFPVILRAYISAREVKNEFSVELLIKIADPRSYPVETFFIQNETTAPCSGRYSPRTIGGFMIKQMEVTELKKILEKDAKAVLIDVREEAEFKEVRAPRAQLLALSAFDPADVSDEMKIPKDQTIYIICRSGGRSMRAAQLLEEVGYKDLVNIAGGTMAWVHNGFETKNG